MKISLQIFKQTIINMQQEASALVLLEMQRSYMVFVDIILIETIMAHEIAVNGGRLITEIISDVHVHIYLGKEMTFANTIIMQSRKLIAPNVSPIIHEHPHPQNAIGSCPFAIVNGKYVTQNEKIHKLLMMLIDISAHARNPREEEDHQQINENSYAIQAFYQMCEELSEVATAMNEDDINPFYVFMNPILKYREHRKLKQLKIKLHLNSHFLHQDQNLNTDYFLYKLHLLEDYMKELQRKRLTIIQGKFIRICVIALLKHFSANNKKIFEAALQHEQFQKVQSRMIEHLTDLSEYYQKLVDDRREVLGAYATFNLQKKVEQKPHEEHENFRQKVAQSLIKPAAVTLVFLTLYRIFSN